MTKSPVFFPLSPPPSLLKLKLLKAKFPRWGLVLSSFGPSTHAARIGQISLFSHVPLLLSPLKIAPPSQPLPPPVLLLALLYLVSSAPVCRRFSLLSLLLALMYRIPSSPPRPSPLSSITLVCSMFHTPTPIRPSWRSLLDFLHLLFPLPNCTVCYFWPLPFSTSSLNCFLFLNENRARNENPQSIPYRRASAWGSQPLIAILLRRSLMMCRSSSCNVSQRGGLQVT